jgi:hypothetical protein
MNVSDCHHMKIKGKGLILSLFLSFVTLLLGWLLFVIICQLGYVLGRSCVWRRVGERLVDVNDVNRVPHGGGQVML